MIALLDLDGTLVDRSAGFAAWARELADRWSLSGDDHAWLGHLDRTVRERRQLFEAVGGRFPQAGTPDEVWRDYRARMPLLTPAFPGVLGRLDALRSAGWRLAVVTNGRTDNQVGKLRRTGIADRVDGWCVSEEVGVAKPDPGIFAAALARLGAADAAGCWMVGDDPAADVAGGRAAGLRTHWVSHGRPWPVPHLRPDRTSASPAEALAALAASTSSGPARSGSRPDLG